MKWDGEQPSQEDYRAELDKLGSSVPDVFRQAMAQDWEVYTIQEGPTGAPITIRRASADSPDGLAGYHEREAAARDEWARLVRHRELADKMLAAAGLEPMAALRAWTADARAMVDVLPDNWLPGQNEAEWARLQLLVRGIFGLVYSGKLEPTRRTRDNRLAAEVREAKMAAERW